MNKNIFWILLIIIVPIATYYGLTRNSDSSLSAVASSNADTVIKFSSPLCSECQDLEKAIDEIFPKYSDKVSLQKIDVTKRNKNTQTLIEQYEVKLVPTTVFKNQDGKVIRRVEGAIEPKDLDMYLVELINE